MKKKNWYSRWHRHPYHAFCHWAVFLLVAGLATFFVYNSAIAATQPIQQQNPNRFPPDLKNEYQQIEAQIQQYTSLVNQLRSIYNSTLSCELACPCGANACPDGTDQTTGLAHDQCITTCDASIPQMQSMAAQIKELETAITQRVNAFKQKLAALKPSDLYPLPSAVACGTDGKTACSEDEARDYLTENPNITINKDPCTKTKTTNCTSVANMRPETLDQISQLQEACNCEIRITGGTEGSHAGGTYSHGNGYKYDMANDSAEHSAVNKYIVDNCTKDNNCKADYRIDKGVKQKRYTYNLGYETVEYVNEAGAKGGSHWDVSVLPAKKTPVKK